MIWTLTLNPSLDYLLEVKDFRLNETNRANKDYLFPAGKGINVSLMLKNLGFESQALGFLAGFSGEEIQKRLSEIGLKSDFIFLKEGHSRINVKISSSSESEINARGPEVALKEQEALFKKIEKIQNGDFLVLSGSLPQGIPSNFYAQILQKCQNRQIKVFLDCAKEVMFETLSMKPYLIKPNKAEIEEMFDLKNASKEEIKQCALKLQVMGAKNVLVSMGKDGAIFLLENQDFLFCKAPQGELKNSVGAGDSMVAGMIAGLQNGFSKQEAFLYSVACGSASAFSQGFAHKNCVESIFNLLKEE